MGAKKTRITEATLRALKPNPKGQKGQEIAEHSGPGLTRPPQQDRT